MIVAGIAVTLARGGAGIAAERLFRGFETGREVTLWRFIARRDPGSPQASLFTEPGRFRVVADQAVDVLGLASHPSWQAWNARANLSTLRRMLAHVRPDVINLHGFNQWHRPVISRGDWLSLSERAPLVWTLHDLWPVSGCCDYFTECPDLCGRAESTTHATDSNRSMCARSSERWKADAAIWKACAGRVAFVSPSHWLADIARHWCGDKVRIEVIPNGLDVQQFAPHDRSAARSALGWPIEGRVLLVVAERLDAARKGMSLVGDALRALKTKATLATLGAVDPGAHSWPAGTLHAGVVDDPRVLRLVYAAVDAVVVPSLVDNLPNVLIEALACGTPCIGFDVGGIPEVVRPGATGWLARARDPADLARAMDEALSLSPAEAAKMRETCRHVAEAEYDQRRQGQRYLDVFASLAGR